MIEMLVSIVLLGSVGLAVLAALQSSIIGARTHDNVAQNQALLAEAADRITDTEPEQIPYVPCTANPTASYQAAVDAAFPPAGTITVSVLNFDGANDFGTTCLYSPQGFRLQQVTLSSEVDTVTRQVSVVKRPVEIPTRDTVPAPPAPPFAGGSGSAIVSPTPGINGP